MFGFLKKKTPKNGLDAIAYPLQRMGYDLLPYGAGVAQTELKAWLRH